MGAGREAEFGVKRPELQSEWNPWWAVLWASHPATGPTTTCTGVQGEGR